MGLRKLMELETVAVWIPDDFMFRFYTLITWTPGDIVESILGVSDGWIRERY